MFYTKIELSPNQKKTPEGFLVCYGCAIARTGVQLYNEMEVPMCEPGPDGMIRVERHESEVFAPETLLSAEGKDIVLYTHPDNDVMPHNWRELSHGHMQNVRRGTGVEDHLLLADLVFKSPESIVMVEQNPRTQLSCGYDSRYKVHGPGHAEQTEIRINHVAAGVVARCGPTCSTRDAAPANSPDLWTRQQDEKNPDTLSVSCSQEAGCSCNKPQRVGDAMSVIQRIKDAFKTKDEKAFGEAVRDAEQHLEKGETMTHDEHHIHLHLGSNAHETKPAGDLPSTGEKEVSSAADATQVGGETAATFGGKAFFADAATNDAFHAEMKGMKDSIMGCHGEMAKIKDMVSEMHEKAMKDAKGEESANEEPNKSILGELKEEAPAHATGDAIVKARDSEFLGDSFKKTCEDAECLVPGIGLPTFDSAAAPADGYKVICGLRRKALMTFGATADGEKALNEVTQVRDFASCSCKDITGAFRATVAMQKTRNSDMNLRSFQDGDVARTADAPKPFTLGAWQTLIDQHWAAEARSAE